ncbi:MAG: hypothetical protein K6A35_04240 [bacterium]|nr:hypothetical protein [bacterium]
MKKYYQVHVPAAKYPVFFEAVNGADYQPGEKVIIEGARGQELGTVSGYPPLFSSTPPERQESLTSAANKEAANIIIGRATAAQIVKAKEQEQQAAQALQLTKARIAHYKLNMHVLSAYISLDGSRIVIEFYASQRVDFRLLVHDLAARLKMRIELHQIGTRDRAILLGGQGLCGRPLCCSKWLRDFSSVSIKMAKVQGLALNPNKVSGVCGRLMCCLKFEQKDYPPVELE